MINEIAYSFSWNRGMVELAKSGMAISAIKS